MNSKDITRNEALRYLGYKKDSVHKADPKTLNILEEALRDLEYLNSFRYAYRVFDIGIQGNTVTISNSDVAFKSASLSKFLADFRRAVFFAATLGAAIDRIIASLSFSSMEKTLIYDSYASAYIDQKCDEAQNIIFESELHDYNNLSRFSPGYGDLSLEYNDVIIDLIDAQKLIGLTSTQTHLLVPQKSIVAIFGLNDKNNIKDSHKCEKCWFADNCIYKDESRFQT